MENSQAAETLKFLVLEWAKRKQPLDPRKAGIETNEDVVIGSRIRPLVEQEIEDGQIEGSLARESSIPVIDLHHLVTGLPGGPKLRSSEFYVDRVYGPDADTQTLYNDLVKPLADLAWNGGIGTFFAYGQTGSGKTYTVSALEKIVAYELLPRKWEKSIHVSIIELGASLNSAFDLLNDRKPISVLEDSFGETRLIGATEPRVMWPTDLIKLINRAAEFRKTSQTAKNNYSSRSHAICKITITDNRTPSAQDGVLYLVDLAGSEIAADVASHGPEQMRETREINKSLSVLKDCIRGRAQLGSLENGASKREYIPFRHSVLTKVLKHVFDPAAGRDCKTAVVACVNPSYLDVVASKNTLRYAEMLRVRVSKPPPLQYDQNDPKTWSNDQVKTWITTNSGSPIVNPNLLAPYHTGAQLLRMPKPEFVGRCMATPNVTEDHAAVVYSKLWRMHISKQRSEQEYSSAVDAEKSAAPFKDRLRPGMVVRLRRSNMQKETQELALVLSPVLPDGTGFSDQISSQKRVNSYVCANIEPAEFQNAYTLNIWKQKIVHQIDMEAEIILEYDKASRYYFLEL